ncbi:MAG: Gfo/Idh/MocA family protein [Capsulimonadaceae bacterium]
MGKVACGVVGVGGIGLQHGAWMQATGVMEIKAVCDPNDAMADAAAEKFPGAAFYSDVKGMLAAEKLRLAVIASPHNTHAPLTITCLEAGLDVVVEKPMAIRYSDCVAMIETAKRAGRLLTVFHNRRLDPWYVAARDVVTSGRLGRLVELRAAWLGSPGDKKNKLTWRSYKETSGGLMFDWGSHLIDNVLHFGNASIDSVVGSYWRRPGSDPALNADHGVIEIRFASGVVGRVTVSDIDREPAARYTLIGEQGTLVDRWSFSGGDMKVYTGDQREQYDVESIPYGSDRGSAPGYYANLAAHYRDGVPVLVTPQSAARVIRVLNAADESFQRGSVPVAFDE